MRSFESENMDMQKSNGMTIHMKLHRENESYLYHVFIISDYLDLCIPLESWYAVCLLSYDHKHIIHSISGIA